MGVPSPVTVSSVIALQRTASRASRPIRGPFSSVIPAWPLEGVAWSVSTNTLTWAGGGSSVMASSTRAVARRHEDSPRVPSGCSGSWSASSPSTLSTTAPEYPSRPPHSLHHDSSREGWRIKNRSVAVRCSVSELIRVRRAASRRTPATSRCSISPTSSGILDNASTRSKETSPEARAARSSGRSDVRRMVRTRLFADSKPRSNRDAVHSDNDRQPSAVAVCARSRSSSISTWTARNLAIADSASTRICSF